MKSLNRSQRQSLRAGFAHLKPQLPRDPESRIPFGGRNFFPTHAPQPLFAIEKNIGDRIISPKIAKFLSRNIRSAIESGETDIQAPPFFKKRPVLAKVKVTVEGVEKDVVVPVCIHRGTHVNRRHSNRKEEAR